MADVDSAIPAGVNRFFDYISTPYSTEHNEGVQVVRSRYPDGKLMLDRLLEVAGVAAALYPPAGPADLTRLLQAIYSSSIDRLKRDCFAFYLLLDYDRAANDQEGRGNGETGYAGPSTALAVNGEGSGKQARDFARARCMPRHWQSFMRGYWAVDHGLWEDALDHLTSPSITSLNFIPEILSVFCTSIAPPSRALSIIHSFFVSIQPPIDSAFLTHIRVLSIAHGMSLWDAFDYIRSPAHSAEQQRHLREGVWAWALGSPFVPAGVLPEAQRIIAEKSGSGLGIRKDILQQLLHLPMNADEAEHLNDFLAHPPRPDYPSPPINTKALDVLHDLVVLRMIHRGQYAESIQLDKQLSGRAAPRGTGSAAASVGQDGPGAGEEGRQRRRELIREFIDVLPPAQRKALALLPPAQSRFTADGGADTTANGHVDEALDSGIGLPGASGYVVPGAPSQPQPAQYGESTGSAAASAHAAGPSLAANRASAYADLSASQAQGSPRPSTPRVQAVSQSHTARNVSTSKVPFAGPPQFRMASIASSAAPPSAASESGTPSRNVSAASAVSRLPSGSPFTLAPGTKVEPPRPSASRRGLRDDHDELDDDDDEAHEATPGMASKTRTTSGGRKAGGEAKHVSVLAPGETDDRGRLGEGHESGMEVEDASQREPNQDKAVVKSTPKPTTKSKDKGKAVMAPPPVPEVPQQQNVPVSTRRQTRSRAGSATPSVASAAHDHDISPDATPSKPPRAGSTAAAGRGMVRSSTHAQLDEGADAGADATPSKKLRSSKSVASLSSHTRASRSGAGSTAMASIPEPEPRTRTRSTPSISRSAVKRSSTTADLAPRPARKGTANTATTQARKAGTGGEGEDTLGELPQPGSVRRSSRRAGSVASHASAEDEERDREVSPALSQVSQASARSTRSRASAREGSATPRAKRR